MVAIGVLRLDGRHFLRLGNERMSRGCGQDRLIDRR